MIKWRISISPCEVKQLNTAQCVARQGWEDCVDHCACADLLCKDFFVHQHGIFHHCLFKGLQEVAYPRVHPYADISWDSEFMGTRRSFPTPVSFLRVFTSAAALALSTNHFQPPPAATTSCALHLFSSSSPISLPPPRSLHLLPSLFLNFSATPLTDLTTFRLLF